METREEIRDGRVFTVTVLPEKKRAAKKAVVKTKSTRRREQKKARNGKLKAAQKHEAQRQNETFAEGFLAAAAIEQERLDRHSRWAKIARGDA